MINIKHRGVGSASAGGKLVKKKLTIHCGTKNSKKKIFKTKSQFQLKLLISAASSVEAINIVISK